MKKASKKYDILAVIGHHEDHKKFDRGTYPRLIYFCYDDEDPDCRREDIGPKGQETVIGPTLYNYVDIGEVIARAIMEHF